MRNLVQRFLFALWILPSVGLSAEMCRLEGSEALQANHPECLFYSGTAEFRNENYQMAANFWSALIAQKTVPTEYGHLKTSAYNNLGYLYFMGQGVKTDKKTAIELWKVATESGNEEAPYHLCHAYGDSKQETYAPRVAIGYCKEALRRYKLLNDQSEDMKEIQRQLSGYIEKLSAR